MRIDFNIAQNELGKFVNSCEAVVRNVETGSKMASEEAISNIVSDALSEVPVDTGTLAASIYGGTFRRSGVKGYVYGGLVGFGGQRGLEKQFAAGEVDWIVPPIESINPKSGLPASAYASRVHEDLDMPHPNGGKAKFLEDPVRNYASDRFARTAMTYWKQAIKWSDAVGGHLRKRNGNWEHVMGRKYRVRHNVFEIQSTGVQRGGQTVYKGE